MYRKAGDYLQAIASLLAVAYCAWLWTQPTAAALRHREFLRRGAAARAIVVHKHQGDELVHLVRVRYYTDGHPGVPGVPDALFQPFPDPLAVSRRLLPPWMTPDALPEQPPMIGHSLSFGWQNGRIAGHNTEVAEDRVPAGFYEATQVGGIVSVRYLPESPGTMTIPSAHPGLERETKWVPALFFGLAPAGYLLHLLWKLLITGVR